MISSPPELITRSQWSAKMPNGRIIPMSRYDYLVLHHAAGYHARDLMHGKNRMREIQALHQENRGWMDVGFHFVIDSGGNVYQGRAFAEDVPLSDVPKLAIGAHVADQNDGKIGICMLGCFHPPAGSCRDQLTAAARRSLLELASFFCTAYEIDPSKITGHREFVSTTCPGNTLWNQLAAIRDEVVHSV